MSMDVGRDPWAFNRDEYVGRGQRHIRGSFSTDGVNNPPDGANANQRGYGYDVVRTGVGTYQITFNAPFPQLVTALATPQNTALVNMDVQVGDYNKTTKSIVVRTHVAGVATDFDGPRVNFDFTFMMEDALKAPEL